MSHPVPTHDPENERVEDYEFAPRKKNPKARALHIRHPSKRLLVKNRDKIKGGGFYDSPRGQSESKVDRLKRLIGESQDIRKGNLKA